MSGEIRITSEFGQKKNILVIPLEFKGSWRERKKICPNFMDGQAQLHK